MKLYLIILLLAAIKTNEGKLTTSKSSSKLKYPKNAIIAIQIIDPHENKTSKRTIDSSLGYGYQNNFLAPSPPKYETYKYSQHDIPPYIPPNYQAPQPARHSTSTSNFYQPGTVLFSSINQHGQLGDLSTQFPGQLENQHYPIPVIILRVHPDQLASPLYPNLPQNHLHASTINSIDINTLLSNYIKQQPAVQPQPAYQYQHAQTHQAYVEPQTEPNNYEYYQDEGDGQNYQATGGGTGENYQYDSYSSPAASVYQQPLVSVTGGGGYHKPAPLIEENYPSDKHTQVIFKRSKDKSTKKQVRVEEPQDSSSIEDNQKQEIPSKYYQPNLNYYTIQYSEGQGYTHQKVQQKAPSYNTEEEDTTQNQRYVYIAPKQANSQSGSKLRRQNVNTVTGQTSQTTILSRLSKSVLVILFPWVTFLN